jgi:hypothetical protein
MIRERHLRYLAAALIVALASYTVASASTILRFALGDLSVTYPTVAATYGPYVDLPPVAYLARERMIQLAPSEDSAQRVEDVKDLLALTPADSAMWLELAKAEAAAQTSPDQVVRALAMSTLTGPNEGRIMAERALFMTPLWDYLPAESRRSMASDVRGGWGLMTMPQKAQLKELLRLASDDERRQISAGLLLQGKEGTGVARELGLPAATPDARTR